MIKNMIAWPFKWLAYVFLFIGLIFLLAHTWIKHGRKAMLQLSDELKKRFRVGVDEY